MGDVDDDRNLKCVRASVLFACSWVWSWTPKELESEYMYFLLLLFEVRSVCVHVWVDDYSIPYDYGVET